MPEPLTRDRALHAGFGWSTSACGDGGHRLPPGVRVGVGRLAGVAVFFTLSGYLITDLLLSQYAAGRLRLREFWLARDGGCCRPCS